MQATATRRVTFNALPHQAQIWQADTRHVALFGGYGAGKTHFNAIWCLKKLLEVEDWPQDKAQGIISANTYPQLVNSTIRNIFGNWREWGIRFKPSTVPGSFAPFTVQVWLNGAWRAVLCCSLNHPDTIRGTEVGFAIIDEAAGTTREAVDIINSRVRATEQPKNQILYTSTVEDPSHWLYEMFVDHHDPEQMTVVYATTYDNPYLPDGYVDALKATYSERLFRREVLAEWVSLESGQIYYAWNRTKNLDESIELDPALPLLWSHDFNIGQDKPLSSVICQIKKGKGPDGKVRPELHAIDELILDTSDTNDAIREFESRDYKSAGVTIYGDASGRARDTRSKTSDYGILRDAGFRTQKVPASNPPLRTRHNIVNALLGSADGDVRLKVHPRCKALAKGLETVKLRKGANYLEEESREQHVTTALGYLACVEFPMRARVTSGRPLIRLARSRA